MSEVWEEKTVESFLDSDRGISVGVMYPGSHTDQGVPLIKVGNIKDHRLTSRPSFLISNDKDEEYKRTRLEGGELLLTLVGNVGQCVYVESHMQGWNVARAVAVLRLKNPDDAHFIRHALTTPKVKALMDAWSNTTVQQTLNLKEIKRLPIPWPSQSIRHTISNTLGTLDDKIELNQRMNKTLEEMAQALFKCWFVDFEPTRAKMAGESPDSICQRLNITPDILALFPNTLTESHLGPIPDGWEVKPASEFYSINIGKTPPRKESKWFTEGGKGMKWVSIRDMGNTGCFMLSTKEELTMDAVSKYNIKTVQEGTVLLSFKLTLGRVCITTEEIVTNEAIAHFNIPKGGGELNRYQTYLYLKSFNYDQLGSTSSIAKAVNSRIIKSMPVLSSGAQLNSAFEEIVTPIFNTIEHLQKQSKTLIQIRDTLLPKLLSGELSVGELLDITEGE